MHDESRRYVAGPMPGPYDDIHPVSGSIDRRPYDATTKASMPQVTEQLEFLEKVSVSCRELIEKLQMRLGPLIAPIPRATNDGSNGRDPRPTLAPMAEQIAGITARISEGNSILLMLGQSLEI